MIEHPGVDYEKALVAIAAYGLPGSVTELPSGPYHDDEWTRLVGMCRTHSLLGMLSAAGHAGDTALSPQQIEELEALEQQLEERVALLEGEAVRASERLSQRGVSHRLLGGLPLRSYYRSPQLRSDVPDSMLLVEPEAADATSTPDTVESEALGTDCGGNQPSIPVHTTIRAAGHSIDVASFAGPPVTQEMAGRDVPTATSEEHLVVACMQLDAQAPNPVAQRDIAELALSPGATAARVQLIAEAWEVTSLVTRALAQVWRRFELADRTELSVWAARGESRLRGAYGPDTGTPGQVLRGRARGAMDRLVRLGKAPTAMRRTPP